jgi:fatty acid desaturase
MKRNMNIYWVDFIVTYAVFVMALFVAIKSAFMLSVVGIIVGALAAYRCGSFIHEIVHFSHRDPRQRAFFIVWNILFGIPLLTPSYLYETHLDHHSTSNFGTAKDPEYIPIKDRSIASLVKFVFWHVMGPSTMVYVRTCFRPLLWAVPRLGSAFGARGSALVINWEYATAQKPRTDWFNTFAAVLSTVVLYIYIALVATGFVPLHVLLKVGAVIFFALLLNGLLTLVAHRYTNYDGIALDKRAQLTDSINLVTHPAIGTMLAPVGLRFHALHHLLPTLPYHNLGTAHARLINALPADNIYHSVNVSSFRQAFIELRQGHMLSPGESDALRDILSMANS